MRYLTLVALCSSFFVLQTQVCNKNNGNSEIFNIEKRVELLFFFKKDTPKEVKDDFYESTLNQRTGDGYWPRDGVQALFGIDRNGYEGFGIKFRQEATKEQRQNIKKLLRESQIVYRVYENVIPEQIKDLE